jgi:bacillithiol system protein YtxJ
MQGSLNAGAIVMGEGTHAVNRIFDVLARDGLVGEIDCTAREMSLGLSAKIENNLNEVLQVGLTCQGFLEGRRHDTQQEIEIICDFLACQFSLLLVRGSICYPRIMLVELHEEQDLGTLFERSQKEPVVLFKHSTQCSRSDAAYEEVKAFLSKHPQVPCGMVLVIEDREVSDALEEQVGIQHESPQAIVISRGSAIWHGSHLKVTAKALEEAIAGQTRRS